MKNWKRFLAAVGTVALIAFNMGAVTQVVFASEPFAVETQLTAEKSAPEEENVSGNTVTDEEPANEAKDSVDGGEVTEPVSAETTEQNSSAATAAQEKSASEANTVEKSATENNTTPVPEQTAKQTDAAPAETPEAADTESTDAKTAITLRYEVNDEKMGSVVDADGNAITGDEAAFTPGDVVTFKTVTAKANDGYQFVKWVSGDGDEITTAELTVKFENTADYNANVSKTYKAVFEEKAAEPELTYPEEEQSFAASVSGYDVSVQVPAKSFAGEVSLQATAQGWDELDSDVRKQLEDEGVGENNSQSIDLTFIDADGKEVEPANEVRVQFTIHNEDALKNASNDSAKLDVYHAEEQKNDNGEVEKVEVKQVASTEDASVTVHSEGEATAEFAVESFSTFTITWGDYYPYATITVHYVDTYGNEIQGSQTDNVINIENNKTYKLQDYAGKIAGYEYEEARLGNNNGDVVTTFKTSKPYWNKYTITFDDKSHTSYSSPFPVPAQANVYLVYSSTKFNIEDKVSTEGNLVAKFDGGVLQPGDKVEYEWQRCESENDTYEEVTRNKATGSAYNVNEERDKLNVVYDHVVANANADTRYFYKVVATVTHTNGSYTKYEAGPYRSPYYFQVQNGSFESPEISSYMTWKYHTDELVWNTTASDGRIEIVNVKNVGRKYNAKNTYGESNAAEGEQFAEINAEADSALFQSVLTTPGATLYWSLSHEARTTWDGKEHGEDETDSMFVVVASDNYTKNLTTQDQLHNFILEKTDNNENWDTFVQSAENEKELSKDNNVSIIKVTSDGSGWQRHTSSGKGYTVPAGQFLTRFFFVAGSCFSNGTEISPQYQNTIGNLVDDISFNENVPAPEPGYVNVNVKKIVRGLEDLNNYSVTVSINGTTKNIDHFEKSQDQDELTWVGETTAVVKIETSSESVDITVNEISAANVENYTVTSTEKHHNGDNKWSNDNAITIGDTDNNGTGPITVREKATAEVVFTNKYTPSTGSLKIVKTLDGTTEYVPDGENYKIDITNASEVDKLYSGKTYNSDGTEVSATDPNANVQFTDGKATVTLQGGQYVIISGLKVGNVYQVQERAESGTAKGYTVSYDYNGNPTLGNPTATITADKDNPATVTIRNSLNVVKTGIRNNGVQFAAIVFAVDAAVALYVLYSFMKKKFLM